jgi:hypothetical protein
MRACHPRDLTDQVVNLCRYHRRRAEITPELLDEVCQSYFLEDSQTGSTAAKARWAKSRTSHQISHAGFAMSR